MSAAFLGIWGQATVRMTGAEPGPSNVETRICFMPVPLVALGQRTIMAHGAKVVVAAKQCDAPRDGVLAYVRVDQHTPRFERYVLPPCSLSRSALSSEPPLLAAHNPPVAA